MTYDDTRAAATPAEIANRVERDGLAAALADHLPDLVRLYRSGAHGLGRELHTLLARDPQVAARLGELDETATKELDNALRSVPGVAAPATSVLDRLRAVVRDRARPFPDVLEGNGTPMLCVSDAPFENWGRTVRNTPALTFVPRTKTGLGNLVRWAAANGRTVRAAGYRHTWADFFSADGQVLVSMLPLDVVEDLPAQEPPIDPGDELQGIEVVGTVVEDGVEKALCRIGAATTNEQFRRWCLDPQGGNLRWTLPLNVVMVEITFGGSNGPICHGAGSRHPTLGDLVASVELVNALGEVQTVDDPALLRAAAGAFGLLGIVTAVTLKLDPMTYANMTPAKTPLPLAVPPPPGFPVPPQVDMTGITEAQLAAAVTAFEDACANDYYAEWFWFPYQRDCWVNTWQNDGSAAAAEDYPSPLDTYLQQAQEYVAELANDLVFAHLPGWVQAYALGAFAMHALPGNGQTIVTPLIDALHFRRGIQNMRVLAAEMLVPIPPRADDPAKPDWTICRQAWWDVLDVWSTAGGDPLRIALEMRVMAGSGVTLAPQYGNTLGTCSIEVVTTPQVPPDVWAAFVQAVTDRWAAYTGPDGTPLNVRPHWAKQWAGLTIHGKPVVDYLRDDAYADRIPEFNAALAEIATQGGYAVADLARFSNPLLADLFGTPS